MFKRMLSGYITSGLYLLLLYGRTELETRL